MAGYQRQDQDNNIADGKVIDAADFDAEYNAIESAFNASSGHTHDGTAGGGAAITKVGPSQDLIVSGTNVNPKTTNTLSLGTAGAQYKDAFFDGTVQTDLLLVDETSIFTGGITANGGVTGSLTGDVTGDLTGNADTATTLATARTFSITGDVTATGVTFDGSGNVTLTTAMANNSVDLGTHTTGNYMTNVSGGTGVTITHTPAEGSTATIAIGQSVGTTDNVTFNTVTANLTGNVTGNVTGDVTGNFTGNITGNADTATALATSRTIAGKSFDGTANITIAATDLSDTNQSLSTTSDVTFNDVTVSGDLTVSGTTTTVNTETINLADNQIVLNSNYTGSSPTENGGIEIERGTQANKTLVWDETNDKWTVGSETFVAGTFEGNLTGDVTGTVQTAAQPNITSLGTLTTLTVDDISINGSTISDATGMSIMAGGNLELDATGDIILDSDSGDFLLKDNGVTQGRISIVNAVGNDDQVSFYAGTTERFRIQPNATTSVGNFDVQGNISATGDIGAAGNLTSVGNTTVLGDLSVNDDIIMTAGASDWKVEVNASNELIISYGGTNKMKLDSSGNLTVTGNVTAYGTV